MITFSAFFTKVVGLAFPDEPADELLPAYRAEVENALITMQTQVKCLQDNHVDYWVRGQVTDYCGLSQVTLENHPMVQSVYAFLPGKSCQRFDFDARTPQFVFCLQKEPRCSDVALPYDPYAEAVYGGNDYCEPNAGGEPNRNYAWEAARKYYAIGPSSRLFLAPAIPCDYVLAVHWNGVKRKWLDADLITDDADVVDTARVALLAFHALNFDRDIALHSYHMSGERNPNSFLRKVGALKHRCRLEIEQPDDQACLHGPDDISAWFNPSYTGNPYIDKSSNP